MKNDPVDFILTHHQLAWLLSCSNTFAMSSIDPNIEIMSAIKNCNSCTFANFPRDITLRWALKKDNLSIKRRTFSVTWRNNSGSDNPVGIVCMGYLLVCAAQMPRMEWNVGSNYGNTVRNVFLGIVMDAFKGNK